MRFISLFLIIGSVIFFAQLSQATNKRHDKHNMVVSEQAVASQVGVDILRAGGNAIDAAVAVGYALAVVNPCCGNIGGGGFMLIHLADGKDVFINFREKAPAKASKLMYEDNLSSVQGYSAVAVPGTVLGLDTALQRYGTMTRQQVMAPAIKLANNGYIVTSTDAKLFKKYARFFQQQPNIAAIFLRHHKPYQEGERLIQQNLAATLKDIAKAGPSIFYQGAIAASIVSASQQHNGLLTLKDFADYTVTEPTPIHCQYRGYEIITAPPPSSGGVTLCEMLSILEHFPLAASGYHTATSTFYIVEAMRQGFIDRNNYLGDPDFVNNPIEKLLSPAYTTAISQQIEQLHFIAPRGKEITSPELTDTTHYSVMDAKGNAVAVTYTLNGFFGSEVMAGKTGFFLNDEMDDFATQANKPNKFGLIHSTANAIAGGKRPLSSMTPTIVMKNGQVVMVLGSPGGPRIITAVLLTLLNVIDYGMTLQTAIDAPRYHYQVSPDSIDFEAHAFSFFTLKKLQAMGYVFTPQSTWAAVEAIYVDSATHALIGANDYRRPNGAALGF